MIGASNVINREQIIYEYKITVLENMHLQPPLSGLRIK